MKRLVLLAVLAAGMMFSAKAQETTWGIRGGLNLSKVSNKYTGPIDDGGSKSDYEGNFKNRVGFHLGVILDWGLCERFYIQPGLFFTTRGAKIEGSEEGVGLEMKIHTSYLQLPILASYRIPLTDYIQWQINAGPYLAYGLGGKTKLAVGPNSMEGDSFGSLDKKDTEEVRGGLKRFDAGLSFGTGISIRKMYFGLSYDLGLANIADKAQWGSDYKIRNRNCAVTVGYNF